MGKEDLASPENFLKKVRLLKEKVIHTSIGSTPFDRETVDMEIMNFLYENRYRILDNLDDAYQAYIDGKIQ